MRRDLRTNGSLRTVTKLEVGCAFRVKGYSQLDGIILDADANVGTTIATGVSQWNDQSGQGNNFLQATGSMQPALQTNQLNGLPAITFDGVDDWFSSLTFNNAQATGTGGAFFFTIRANSLSASGTHDFLFVAGAAEGINPGVQITNSNTSLIAGGGLNSGQTMTTTGYHAYTFIHSQVATDSQIRRDNVQLAKGNDGSAGTGTGFTLGSLAGGSRSVGVSIAHLRIMSRIPYEAEASWMERVEARHFALPY